MTLQDTARKLVELAAKATPGPYLTEHNIIASHVVLGNEMRLGDISVPYGAWRDADRRPREKQQSEYFAACDPTTISRLCRALEAANAVIDITRRDYSAVEIVESLAAFDAIQKEPG